jgi:putative transposase
MSELRKANVEGGTYFVTFTVVGWIDVFTRKEYCELILKNLKFCQLEKSLELFALVIMPSHVHLVARRKDGNLNELIRDFKSAVAKQIIKAIETETYESRRDWLLYMLAYYAKHKSQNEKYMFWQKTNHPIELWSSEVIDQKISYVENNPVATGIVLAPAYYQWSSANRSLGVRILRP